MANKKKSTLEDMYGQSGGIGPSGPIGGTSSTGGKSSSQSSPPPTPYNLTSPFGGSDLQGVLAGNQPGLTNDAISAPAGSNGGMGGVGGLMDQVGGLAGTAAAASMVPTIGPLPFALKDAMLKGQMGGWAQQQAKNTQDTGGGGQAGKTGKQSSESVIDQLMNSGHFGGVTQQQADYYKWMIANPKLAQAATALGIKPDFMKQQEGAYKLDPLAVQNLYATQIAPYIDSVRQQQDKTNDALFAQQEAMIPKLPPAYQSVMKQWLPLYQNALQNRSAATQTATAIAPALDQLVHSFNADRMAQERMYYGSLYGNSAGGLGGMGLGGIGAMGLQGGLGSQGGTGIGSILQGGLGNTNTQTPGY